jgi:hypothetical protein
MRFDPSGQARSRLTKEAMNDLGVHVSPLAEEGAEKAVSPKFSLPVSIETSFLLC